MNEDTRPYAEVCSEISEPLLDHREKFHYIFEKLLQRASIGEKEMPINCRSLKNSEWILLEKGY